jgi:hypothetical protein
MVIMHVGRGAEKDATLLQAKANKTAIVAPRFRRREKAECRVVVAVDMVWELELSIVLRE